MIRSVHTYLMLGLLALGCGSTRVLQEETAQTSEPQAPAWVQSRPSSSMYYIGIGRARKSGSPDDYQRLARKNGLNDMAGEIEVKVTSNSLLHTLESNGSFSENFSESIQTSTELDLEGFEVFDSYSDQDYYHVYYRLSKSHYKEVMAQRKEEALNRAKQHLAEGRAARDAGDITAAANSYVDVLTDLKSYWGEDNLTEISTARGLEEIYIDKVAFEELSAMRRDFHLSMTDGYLVLDESNDFHKSIVVKPLLGDTECSTLKFTTKYGKESIQSQRNKAFRKTFHAGMDKHQGFDLSADPFEEARRKIKAARIDFLKDQLKPEVLHLQVQVNYPKVTVRASQQGIDGGMGSSPLLASAVTRELSKIGIGVDETGESPYVIEVEAKSRDGGVTQGFQVVYTDMTIVAKQTQLSSVRYSQDFPGIKGVHRDTMNAAAVALGKCGERITPDLMKPLIDALF